MEFEDIKKIWDMQNNETLYAINETALHNRILSKKRSASQISNISELIVFAANFGTCLLVLGMVFFNPGLGIFMYLLAGWTFIISLYLLLIRAQRKKTANQFDRSLLGDLDHALSNATYQVRLSGVMLWNNLPLGILVLLGFWEKGKLSVWIVVFMLVFFAFTYYVGGWEHNIYRKKKRNLEVLKEKLNMEEGSSS
jgi:Flp pilus assembly protein TadB